MDLTLDLPSLSLPLSLVLLSHPALTLCLSCSNSLYAISHFPSDSLSLISCLLFFFGPLWVPPLSREWQNVAVGKMMS